MKYDTEQMTFIGTAGTAEESAALALHYEIIAAAQTAAASLLDLARKIKRMRDTSGYKALGFDSLEAYTMATMGMKQRQAYNYIAIAEKLPAQLIEQNAAAGVTKLALLAQLSGQEQQQIAAETNLTDTTVAELKAQIKELQAKNAGYAEQLSLLQDQQPVAEAQAEEVDMDALRAKIRAEVKAEMDSLHQADAKMAELNQKERDEAVKAAKDAREKLAEAQQAAEDAEKAHAEELEKVKRQAWEDARTAEDNYKKPSWLKSRVKPRKKPQRPAARQKKPPGGWIWRRMKAPCASGCCLTSCKTRPERCLTWPMPCRMPGT